MTSNVVNLTCENRTSVYPEHNSWFQRPSIWTCFIVYCFKLFFVSTTMPEIYQYVYIDLPGTIAQEGKTLITNISNKCVIRTQNITSTKWKINQRKEHKSVQHLYHHILKLWFCESSSGTLKVERLENKIIQNVLGAYFSLILFSVKTNMLYKSVVTKLYYHMTFNYYFSSLMDNGLSMGLKYNSFQGDQSYYAGGPDFYNPVFMASDAWLGN